MADLLSIIQRVCQLTALPVPATVVDSQDAQVQQLYALANEEGEQLRDSHDWQRLTRQYTFASTGTEDQPTAIPADLERWIANTMFDRNTRREVLGPITPQMWQAIKSQPQLNRVFLAWRQRDDVFYMTPDPSAGDTIAYEYVSKNWVEAANGDPKDQFTADTDSPVISSRLITWGVRWRFLQAKGIDYAQYFDEYQRQLAIEKAKDGGNGKLMLSGTGGYWAGYPNVPLGNWPGPI